jgi:hypothetical protein
VVGRVDLGGGEAVLVELLASGEDGRVILRARTDGYGNYVFVNIFYGEYQVRVVRENLDNVYGEIFSLDRNTDNQYGIVALSRLALPPAVVSEEGQELSQNEDVYAYFSEPDDIDVSEIEELEEEEASARSRRRAERGYVLSVRPEMVRSVSSDVGGVAGLGILSGRGFYLGAEFRGGQAYLGGDLNIGYMFNKDRLIRNILGISGGWQNKKSQEKVLDRGVIITEYERNNYAFGGVFWKFLVGRRINLDITNKLLFGYRTTGIYTESLTSLYDIEEIRRFNMTYSLGIGVSLIRSRSNRRNR